jgi:hypothetical protein
MNQVCIAVTRRRKTKRGSTEGDELQLPTVTKLEGAASQYAALDVTGSVLRGSNLRRIVVMLIESSAMIENPSLHIDYKDLTLGEEIGSGAFGVVFKGTWRLCEVRMQSNADSQVIF